MDHERGLFLIKKKKKEYICRKEDLYFKSFRLAKYQTEAGIYLKSQRDSFHDFFRPFFHPSLPWVFARAFFSLATCFFQLRKLSPRRYLSTFDRLVCSRRTFT